MALYSIYPKEVFYEYAYNWSDFHQWGYRDGVVTRNADDYCAGQTYLDLYRINQDPNCIRKVKANLDMLVNTPQDDDWWWIDAVQMGMPVFAKLGATLDEPKYWDKMWDMYEDCRNKISGTGLFNQEDGLWWRDADFIPPYQEPNGEDCYWSRGNGWVYAALVRVLSEIPKDEKHYKDYVSDYMLMTKAIVKCQREDGFWNVSLHDPENYGGKEVTGTSLFLYGLAWGVNNGLLSYEKYGPFITKAWTSIVKDAIHPNGFLGYVQGTGKEPKDGQPVTFQSMPDFEDYGIGCFLLAGVEVYKMKQYE
ncbi:glycoside hydrolase family 88/105 protein [Saccharicrinis fermentans]|uniref:Unsaturated rhamnogalacturonyl hydrolase YteR n=2 Tax=Saccharicrinis fermentans TaxID=982 RepID=W7Y2E7_9BACT|nr:glycoside hydrolase family 88 protein [Saccharicrinis fermentans]GAF02117.1 unsaturated rhamnogalacturonyl hydrolase YteR [Saccharicrinis fermentans DSM 9555 = JCM 21142]